MLDLSWDRVERYLRSKQDILIPIGSVEEHGYHLPLSTDGDIATAIAEELGKRLGILVAPVVWYGVAETTKDYAGSVMVSFDALRLYVKEILQSLERQGFRRVFLVLGHFSSSQKVALREAAKGVGLEVHLLDASQLSFEFLETKPCHACEAETSLMLYLHPEKVEMEKATDEQPQPKRFSSAESFVPTRSGVFGWPTKASSEKGKLLFERIIGEFEAYISSLR